MDLSNDSSDLEESRKYFAVWLAALFVVILGAKLRLIQIYATNILYWDQWDEARMFFKPWLEGHLTWSAWVAPHNEHRIFFTRALDWLEVWLNGQWDPRLQMVVNAFIHAGFAVGLAAVIWKFTGKKNGGLVCSLLAPFFMLPFAAENTLHGFQSQMYFLGIFSLAAMLGLAFCRPGSIGWLSGLLAAVLSIFTMGSGFLAVMAVSIFLIFRCLKQQNITRGDTITLIATLAVACLGLWLGTTVEFQAKSAGTFLWMFVGNLAWPFGSLPLACLPLIVLAFEYFRGEVKSVRAAEFAFLLMAWGGLQAAALAFGRPNYSYSSRYLDTLCIIPIAVLVGLLTQRKDTVIRRLMFATWVAAIGFGLWQATRSTTELYLPWSRTCELRQSQNVRAFEMTDDPFFLKGQTQWAVPYWNPERLMDLLHDKNILSIMPPDCRLPLKLEPDSASDGSFVCDGYASETPKQPYSITWGSFTTNDLKSNSLFVSQPLQSHFPRLFLPVCCGKNMDGLLLEIVDATGQKTELHPQIASRWHDLVIVTPPHPFRLQVTDTNPHSWIAIGAPREAGIYSVGALQLANQSTFILLAGLGGFIILAGQNLLRRRGGTTEWLIIVAGLAVSLGVWHMREINAANMTSNLEKVWAVHEARAGRLYEAKRAFQEALWARPDDQETHAALAALVSSKTNTLETGSRKLPPAIAP